MDLEKISEEYIKCVSDPTHMYMIENYLKTYDMRERKDVPFHLFPRQKDLLNTYTQSCNVITTKPRQAGITTTTAAFLACQIALASPESPEIILVIGNKLDLAQQMVTKIKDFLYQLPRWFWGSDYFSPDPKSEKNQRKIFKIQNQSNLVLCNNCKVVAKSSGPNAARGVSSVSWLVFDEAAFIENGLDVYAQAVATTSTGGRTIMISTPYGKDPLYYGIYNKAKKGENNFAVVELKWYQDPRYNPFLKWVRKDKETGEVDVYEEPVLDKSGRIEYNEAHWEDMVHKGYKPTSPWFIRMCNSFNNDPQKIAQELEVSFLGSANNVVDPEFIDMQRDLNNREPDPNFKDPVLEETWIWKMPIEGHRYIISCDASRGDASDATAIEVLDIDGIDEDGTPCIEQVLEYNGKIIGDACGEVVNSYGRMYNDAFCVVEDIGGYGSAALITLMNLKYPNLYYDDTDLKTYTMQNRIKNTNTMSNDGKLPGFHSSSVRFQMLSNFANMIRTNQIKIRSKRVISELETWIFKDGRMDHMDGCHDDTLTCLAMALFVMQFSMNKQIQARSKDAALLRAMIMANNRIQYVPGKTSNPTSGVNPNQIEEISKKYALPIYTSKNNTLTGKAATYKANMWVFGNTNNRR